MCMFISLQSYHHNVWAIQKEIKDTYPKKACHMPARHVKKKEEKKKIQPIPKILQGREKSYKGVFIHHPPKIPTHLHILIKAYDLFHLRIRFLTQQNMRSKFAIISSIPTDPPKKKEAIRSRMEKERHIKTPW